MTLSEPMKLCDIVEPDAPNVMVSVYVFRHRSGQALACFEGREMRYFTLESAIETVAPPTHRKILEQVRKSRSFIGRAEGRV